MNYKGPVEAALSTDLRGEPYNFSLWDVYTGTQLVVFKANDNVLHIWSVFNRKCQDQKLFLPARPSSLCTSPCSNYLAVAISEMIYIWQLGSGNLLAHTQRHYQSVSVLKMSRDGAFLFSGGEDGMVLVWPFADLISNTHNTGALNLSHQSRKDVGVNEPRFTWQHHSAQVTDIHVTNGGRCLTVSVDMTINIYSYADGKRLYCVSMPSPIWSVVMDKNETRIFLGGQDGCIYEVAVSSISLSLFNLENSGASNSENGQYHDKSTFVGHKGKVVNLTLSADGSRLVSASIDSTCKIWDVNRKKLLQDIKHQAPLANLTSLLVPDTLALSSMTQSQARPQLSLRALKRNLYKSPRDGTVMCDDLFDESSTPVVQIKNRIDLWNGKESRTSNRCDLEVEKSPEMLDINDLRQQQVMRTHDSTIAAADGGESLHGLKKKIRELYLLSAEKIFCDAAVDSLKRFKPII